jgi:hypothetical protein
MIHLKTKCDTPIVLRVKFICRLKIFGSSNTRQDQSDKTENHKKDKKVTNEPVVETENCGARIKGGVRGSYGSFAAI